MIRDLLLSSSPMSSAAGDIAQLALCSPSYTTATAQTVYVSVITVNETTEADRVAAEAILNASFGGNLSRSESSEKGFIESVHDSHGERLRLVLLHVGTVLSAVATLVRLDAQQTLIENLCVEDEHRSRGLTSNLFDGIAAQSPGNDLFIFARSPTMREVGHRHGYVHIQGADRKDIVTRFVDLTGLAYDNSYYAKVPLLRRSVTSSSINTGTGTGTGTDTDTGAVMGTGMDTSTGVVDAGHHDILKEDGNDGSDKIDKVVDKVVDKVDDKVVGTVVGTVVDTVVDKNDGGDTGGADDDGFLDHGPYVSYRLRIERPEYTIDGTVVEYLPASQNDGVDLWKVRHDDGDLEDLERHELLQWIRKRPRGRPPAGMRWEGGMWRVL